MGGSVGKFVGGVTNALGITKKPKSSGGFMGGVMRALGEDAQAEADAAELEKLKAANKLKAKQNVALGQTAAAKARRANPRSGVAEGAERSKRRIKNKTTGL